MADLVADVDWLGGEGRYEVVPPDSWSGFPGQVFGGFVGALLVRAAGCEAVLPAPATLTAMFLRPVAAGVTLELGVTPVRRGRAVEVLRVVGHQQGRQVVEALVQAVAPADGFPEFEPEAGAAARPAPEALPHLADVLAERYGEEPTVGQIRSCEWRTTADPATARDADGHHAIWSWFRLGPGVTYDDPWLEAGRACVPLDTQTPAVFERAVVEAPEFDDESLAGTSLDFLVHFHRSTGLGEWLLYETASPVAAGGLGQGQARVWSQDGHLVGTAMSLVKFVAVPDEWRRSRTEAT